MHFIILIYEGWHHYNSIHSAVINVFRAGKFFNFIYKLSTLIQNKTPLEGGATEHSGCMFCDPIFSSLVEVKHASARRNRAPRGRGGGRGRGGRGRGRGGKGRGKPKDKMAQLAAYFV